MQRLMYPRENATLLLGKLALLGLTPSVGCIRKRVMKFLCRIGGIVIRVLSFLPFQ